MKDLKEKIMKLVFLMAATASIAAAALICIFLFKSGIPAIAEIGIVDFIFGREWRPANDIYGIFPMIVGSIYVTVGALILGVPVGILTAVYMVEFSSPKLYKIMKPAINLMAGIPSVVYGFFGLVVLVPFVRDIFGGRGMSVLAASILLALMILPTIISMSESAIRAVPRAYYEGGLALGASHERSVFFTVVPAAKSGIFAGITLGLGRAIGETMGDILYDEKIMGSIHFTPGCCYEDCSNGNKSSIHWDLVLIQTKEFGGGEI